MRFIRVIIFVLVLAGLIWLLVAMFQLVFSGSNNTSTPEQVDQVPALSTYADTSAKTSMFIDGPIVVNKEHTSVRITVDRNQSFIEVMKGYDNRVVAQQAFANNEAGYTQFLGALDRLGFASVDTDQALKDSIGSCPYGNRYNYTLSTGTKSIIDTWATSCSTREGNYLGEHTQTKRLFLAQIPRDVLYDMTRGISL